MNETFFTEGVRAIELDFLFERAPADRALSF